MNQASVECPKCGTAIDVDDILRGKLEKELRLQYEAQLQTERTQLLSKESKLKEIQAKFVKEKASFEEKVTDEVRNKLKTEKEHLTLRLKTQLAEEKADEFKSLQQELEAKSLQVRELHQTKAEIEKLKREKIEIRDQIELENQKKFTEQLNAERIKLAKLEADRSELKLAERDKVITQLNDQLKDAQRKAEQGSMQLQGEVQELAIEEWLRSKFPFDTIDEIKKGARGGDCIQIVNTREVMSCGSIYYESKRTKEWQPAWIEKFKLDMRVKGADIGVIVTEAMPKNMERMGLVDGIWVCTLSEFKGLCYVLRQQIVVVRQKIGAEENKGDKMEMLYGFLTSNEFKMQIEGIVSGFTTMQDQLLKEKSAMGRIWNQRQKQIEKVVDNTVAMYGSIRGIAGKAIPTVSALELGDGLDNEDEDLL